MQTLSLLLILLFSSHVFAGKKEYEDQAALLTNQIEASCSDQEKSRLHLFRARQYAQLGKNSAANQDYSTALKYHYAGWIANEYGYFLYHQGEYAQAYKMAKKVIHEFPQLKPEAEKLKKMAGDKFKEEYLEKNPPTIVMDTKVDPSRVTRHDLIRKMRPKKAATYKYPSVTKASSPTPSTKSSGTRGRT